MAFVLFIPSVASAKAKQTTNSQCRIHCNKIKHKFSFILNKILTRLEKQIKTESFKILSVYSITVQNLCENHPQNINLSLDDLPKAFDDTDHGIMLKLESLLYSIDINDDGHSCQWKIFISVDDNILIIFIL